jgi:hypothetical protein
MLMSFCLETGMLAELFFLLGGVLKKEIQEKDFQVLEAKELTHKNKEKDKIAAEKLGLKYRDMLPFYLSEIYLKERIKKFFIT